MALNSAAGHRRARYALLAITGAILLATVLPTSDSTPNACIASLICGDRGLADVLLNVVLFVPLGWALTASKLVRPAWVMVLLPAGMSLGIELLQIVIPGRHSNPGDVVFNSLGGAVGILVAPRMFVVVLARRASDWAALAWMGVLVLLFTATGRLLQPQFPQESVYFGQWTPTLGGMAPYRGGRVISAAIEDEPMPSYGLANTPRVREHLTAGRDIEVRFVVAPEPPGLAPVFAIADRSQVGILLFGVVPGRLVVIVRTLADAFRLNAPNHEIPTPPLGGAPGDTVVVRFNWAAGPGTMRFDIGGVETTMSRWTLARGWAVLYHRLSWPPFFKRILDMLWMVALFLPLGYFSRRSLLYGITLTGVIVAVGWIGAIFDLSAVRVGWAGAVAGVAGGRWLPRLGRGIRTAVQ